VNVPIGIAGRGHHPWPGGTRPGRPQASRPDWAGFALFTLALARAWFLRG